MLAIRKRHIAHLATMLSYPEQEPSHNRRDALTGKRASRRSRSSPDSASPNHVSFELCRIQYWSRMTAPLKRTSTVAMLIRPW